MKLKFKNIYEFTCRDKNGNLKWQEKFENTVTDVGANEVLDNAFNHGISSPIWFLGLKGSGSLVSSDTMLSHPAWTEITSYTNSTRVGWTPGTVAGRQVNNSLSVASFTMNAGTSINGAFLCSNSTKGGISGTLFGGGDFPVTRVAASGDVITVIATIKLI